MDTGADTHFDQTRAEIVLPCEHRKRAWHLVYLFKDIGLVAFPIAEQFAFGLLDGEDGLFWNALLEQVLLEIIVA